MRGSAFLFFLLKHIVVLIVLLERLHMSNGIFQHDQPQIGSASILVSPDFEDKNSVVIGHPTDNQEGLVLVPSSSKSTDFVNLKEISQIPGSSNLLPDSLRLQQHALRQFLEPDFDTQWMSINKPQVLTAQEHVSNPFALDKILSQSVNKLNLSHINGMDSSFETDPRVIFIFKSWLLRRAFCPLQHLWEDLGELFWPRWIKRGACLTEHGCSWPEGMKCKASGTRNIKVLRWVCFEDKERRLARARLVKKVNKKIRRKFRRNRSDKGISNFKKRVKRRKSLRRHIGNYICQWKIADYPVTNKCSCLCS